MILIYTTKITPRISFISKFLFSEILNIPCRITSGMDDFKVYKGPKLNYSNEKSEGLLIKPASFLFETGISSFVPEVGLFQGMPVLFPVSDKLSLPFDIFAASFYMITRYEEYLPQPMDIHRRVLPSESIAYKNGFLNKPVVDQWAMWLRKIVEENYPEFYFPHREYQFIPTVDVDIAYAYRHRGFLRTMGAASKSVIKGNWRDFIHRFQTLFLHQPDPYDTFELFRSWFTEFNLTPKYFFLVGKYGRYDKNIAPTHTAMKDLMVKTHNKYEVGVHPSYKSNTNPEVLHSEINKLKQILNDDVKISRQHFLKLQFPETYQQLIANGITEDYSMGYASLPGFRAGTCTPFPFYDLTSENETSLQIYPFQVMDGTLNNYMKLSPDEALVECKKLIDEVKKVNGTFISLWHNESLSEMREWKQWRTVYYKLLEAGT